MARRAHAALADLRALEEQAERANPIAPSTKRKAVKGAGATPSMGLSQFRGGRTRKMPSLEVEELKMKPSLHNAMEDEMALMPSGEYDGAGKHSLMDHLASPMKGFGDYLHAFEAAARKGGLKTGKYDGEGATPSMGLSQFRGGVTHQPSHSPVERIRGGMAMGQVVGSGKMKLAAMDADSESENEMDGGIAIPAPAPAGKKKRAPAGPEDGRRKRAAIVKKVMADKGLSMILASKYVKDHNMY